MQDIVSHFPASECVIVAEFSYDTEIRERCYTVTIRSRDFSFPASCRSRFFLGAWSWEKKPIIKKVEEMVRTELLVQKEIPIVIAENWIHPGFGQLPHDLLDERREIIGNQRHRI